MFGVDFPEQGKLASASPLRLFETTSLAESAMPVARIYASLVEEAEPICADLLARGYNVEVVFPDAVLTVPADLELRVERCSAEQAIARVESGAGSSSRCVFVTRAKGPRQELLLVEMTVLATGTNGRHPVSMPANIPIPNGAVSVPLGPGKEQQMNAAMAAVLPFPAVSQKRRRTDTVQPQVPVLEDNISVPISEPEQSPRFGNEGNLNKNMIAEVNAFLAHAPAVEPEESLPVKILEDLRHSRGFERVRKNWEALTLLGIAVSFVVLVTVGWYAGPTRPRQAPTETATTPQVAVPQVVAPVIVAPQIATPVTPVASRLDLKSVVLETQKSTMAPVHRIIYRRNNHLPSRRKLAVRDNLIARDKIARVNGSLLNRPHTQPSIATTIGPAPIKKITDLK